ncbi:MAG: methyltransferase domain-containing protein [Clostridiales bacterium]|nr:methyltransferase domain-containing protein [Clostridiales bacterium]
MNEYCSLANFYDRIMCDNDYEAWADYFVKMFSRMGAEPKTILDLACGTGIITCLLAEKGYELIGVDVSPDMLMEANARAAEGKFSVAPMFINQDLRELDLYGTSDAAICSFDGFNYIPPEELAGVFKRVSYFVQPGGVFIFDVNTEAKFRKMDGMTYIDEDEDFFCAWRTDYYEEERECVYGVDIFRRTGKLWERTSEEHVEYTPDLAAISAMLSENGFENVRLFGELSFEAPGNDEDRVFICCRRKG